MYMSGDFLFASYPQSFMNYLGGVLALVWLPCFKISVCVCMCEVRVCDFMHFFVSGQSL